MEELIEALMDAIEKKIAHDKAREEHDGYNWDYHGCREIKKMEEFQDKLKNALKEAITEMNNENRTND